jgi:hypothetical protein
MASGRLWARILFRIEQLLVRGAGYRLLIAAAAIAVLSVVGGLLVLPVPNDELATTQDATWWAFLRLSDPGYLGDDEGPWRRVVSTALTILGYVVFLGALVAILTQWLNATLERLELGLSPVRTSDHIVILGWTSRTPAVVAGLMRRSARQQRFLEQIGASRMQVVILAPRVSPELVQELKDELEDDYRERDIILRSGSPLKLEHLERVDAFHAAAIVMPGDLYDTDEGSDHDARVLSVLLSLTAHRRSPTGQLPRFVGEISDPTRIEAARTAYAGELDLLPTDALISRMIGGSARQPGFSQLPLHALRSSRPVFKMVRVERGVETVEDARTKHDPDVVVGVIRSRDGAAQPFVVADVTEPVDDSDTLVVAPRRRLDDVSHARWQGSQAPSRFLILGWSAKAPDLIADLAQHGHAKIEDLCVLSRVPAAERVADLAAHDLGAAGIRVRHLEGNDTSPRFLAQADPAAFDVVILLASETSASGEEADADTIAAHTALQELLTKAERPPHCIVELLDPDSVALLRGSASEIVMGGPFMAYATAQTVLVRLFLALLNGFALSTEHEVRFEPVDHELDLPAFRAHQQARAQARDILVGFRRGRHSYISPADGDPFPVREGDELIVFARERAGAA